MISVIIPALNEERSIGGCISRIKEEKSASEIIVADGGSSDRTKEIVTGFSDVRFVSSEKGRGLQMNSGAARAKGEILLFLHADTRLEPGWSTALRSALDSDDKPAGGAFSFRIDNPSARYRIVEALVALRCLLLKTPYGDQCIFVRRTTFEKIGGYPAIPLMEDIELVRTLKKAGKIVILRHKAYTDSRRWEKKGILQTYFSNQFLRILYMCGVSPRILAERYYR
jgi:rSAM/selenodomain-associated transferase 2